jgi:hypothetical protein
MRNWKYRKLVFLLTGTLLFGAGVLVGQRTVTPQRTLIHAFAFQAQQGVTDQQVKELWGATQRMVGQIPGIRNVWMGPVLNRGPEWQYGVVMEFQDQAALKVYADHPAHREWEKIYGQVRVPGTNTLDIQGQ